MTAEPKTNGKTAAENAIEVDRIVGNKVIVAKGLKAGERILVEGSQKAPPGSVVKAVPFHPPSDSGTQPKPN